MDKIVNFLKIAGKLWIGGKILKLILDFVIAGFLCWFLIDYVSNITVAIIITALLLCVVRLWK